MALMDKAKGCWVLSAFAVTLGCAGEPRVLSPRTPPPRELPSIAIPSTPVPDGFGRVVLDTQDESMRVTVEHDPRFTPPGAPRAVSHTGELCATPCVVDLPIGYYRLFLFDAKGGQRGDKDDLSVQAGLNVYRRAVGQYVTPTIATRVAPTVVVILAAGLMVAGASVASREKPGLAVGLVGAGVALGTAGGIWLYDASRATEQQGATTYFRQPLP